MHGSEQAWQARRSGINVERIRDHRSPWERDRGRLLHSGSFRRLQAKTQVLGIGDGDFHRTRLTHSIEVAQIAVGLVQQLEHGEQCGAPLPDRDLIETIAIAHDLGHPPFGHGGEVALNYSMREFGGFEGNGQSLRLLSRLESHTPGFGLDLTRRAMLGVLKYPRRYSQLRKTARQERVEPTLMAKAEWKPPKCYLDTEQDIVNWMLEPLTEADRREFIQLKREPSGADHGRTRHKSFDCSIMELADDIAYGVHDLEDGIALGMVEREELMQLRSGLPEDWLASMRLEFPRTVEELFNAYTRKRTIGQIVHALMISARCSAYDQFESPLLRFRAELSSEARVFLDALQRLVVERVINRQTVQTLEYRGRYMVIRLFEALSSAPKRLLPESFAPELDAATSEGERSRVICDYIACMTDSDAARMYQRLFIPGEGSVFERL